MLRHKDLCEKGQYLIFIFDIVCLYSSIKYKTSCLKTKARKGRQAQRMDELNNARVPQNVSRGTEPPETNNVTHSY